MATASAVPVPASHLDVARDAEPATKTANAELAVVLNRNDQVADVVDLGDHVVGRFGVFRRGDLQHLVLDRVAEMQRFEQQHQRAF